VLRLAAAMTAVGAVLQVEVLLGAEQAAALKKLVKTERVETDMVKKELMGSPGPCCMLL
jgi:hypothetical protein